MAKFNLITSGKYCELGALFKSKFIGFLKHTFHRPCYGLLIFEIDQKIKVDNYSVLDSLKPYIDDSTVDLIVTELNDKNFK